MAACSAWFGSTAGRVLAATHQWLVLSAATRCRPLQVASLDLAPYHAIRWQRKRLVSAGAGASQPPPPGSQASAAADPLASQLEEQWEQAPHVMVCFQVGLGSRVLGEPLLRLLVDAGCLHLNSPAAALPLCLHVQPQEFIDAVLRDRLASLFALLERRAPGQRPYLLVFGLAAHMLSTERKQHKADMGAHVLVRARWAAVCMQLPACVPRWRACRRAHLACIPCQLAGGRRRRC